MISQKSRQIINEIIENRKSMETPLMMILSDIQNTFGYIDFVDELMSISHCLFGKTGGLSATEALAKNLPIISFANIPSPEYDNLMFLQKFGFACPITKCKQIATCLANPPQKDISFYIPNSANLIYDIITREAPQALTIKIGAI
jgi:UDP-N-acetylglucosamine:LPS N-acetylglucosamine transferase